MSVERLVISALVDEGAAALRTLYSHGVGKEAFAVYDEEFAWIEQRLARRKPLNRRVFTERFDDFEWMRAKESTADLAVSLKEEAALAETNQLVQTLAEQVRPDNVLDMLVATRDRLSAITRRHAPMSDVDLDEWQSVVEEFKQAKVLAAQGKSLSILTGIEPIDSHLGGLMPGQFIQVNGRTGEGKSMWTTLLAWRARKHAQANVGIFSPELNKHETRCRYHTIASADKDVQEAVGIEKSFRNRALMDRRYVNIKTYQRFMEYIAALPGSMHLLCGTGMREQMSVGYIEDKIVEYELDLVVVDPIYLLKPVREHRDGNVYQEVAWIAESLHRVGEQYDIPIVFTNQAHLDGNKGDAPSIEKSFGAKALLHLADYVLAVRHMSEENLLIVKSNKSRFGQGFRFTATFIANTGFFSIDDGASANYYNGSDDPDKEDVREYVANTRPRKGK